MIQHEDILLDDNEILIANGDLVAGNGQEQFLGAIANASKGNFRKWPTLGPDLFLFQDGVLDSRAIAAAIQNALFLDGWELDELDINQDVDEITVIIRQATKTTDNTQSLI